MSIAEYKIEHTDGRRGLSLDKGNELRAALNEAVVIYDGGAKTANATAAEVVSVTATIPAGALQAGDVLLISALATATGTTGTQTSNARVRIGGASGPVVAATGAVDVADSDVAKLSGRVDVIAIGAPAASSVAINGQAAWATTVQGGLVSTALDTTAAITVVGTIENSSTGNSCVFTHLRVVRLRAA